MDYALLTAELTRLAPFENLSDARLALASSMETLGFLLPEQLVKALKAALPSECASALEAGRADGLRSAPGHAREAALARGGQTLERIQEICGALAKLLPSDLVADLQRELPPPLARAFAGSRAQQPSHVVHGGGIGRAARHLSDARPGSAHSLASGHPRDVQQDSVAAANPHADTKLSSARGLTQERGAQMLAESAAERRRRREPNV